MCCVVVYLVAVRDALVVAGAGQVLSVEVQLVFWIHWHEQPAGTGICSTSTSSSSTLRCRGRRGRGGGSEVVHERHGVGHLHLPNVSARNVVDDHDQRPDGVGVRDDQQLLAARDGRGDLLQ